MFAPELRNRRLPAAFTVLLCCKHTFISTGGLHHLEDHATILHRTLLIMLHSEVKWKSSRTITLKGAVASVICSVRHACCQQPGGQSTLYSASTFSSDPSVMCTNMLEIFYQSPEVPAGSRLERFNHWSVSQWGSGLNTLLSIVENPSWRTHLRNAAGDDAVLSAGEHSCQDRLHTFLDRPSCCCLFRFTLYIFLLMPLALPLFLFCTISVHATSSTQFSMSLIFITAIHKNLHYCIISLSLYY